MEFPDWIQNNPGLIVVLIGIIGIVGSIIGSILAKRKGKATISNKSNKKPSR